MKTVTICGLALALFAGGASAQERIMKDLAPTGKLRVGLVFAGGVIPRRQILLHPARR